MPHLRNDCPMLGKFVEDLAGYDQIITQNVPVLLRQRLKHHAKNGIRKSALPPADKVECKLIVVFSVVKS
jgi:hypothetical protein